MAYNRGGAFVALLVVLSVATLVSAGLYGPKSAVVSLTKSNFAQAVIADEHVWLVEFYAPWCGHCKNLAPEWEKAAAGLKGLVKVGAVNCDDEKELCGSYGIQGFPTIKLFPAEQVAEKKGVSKKPVDYQQARSAGAISKFALGFLPNYVTTLTAASYDKFAEKPEIGKVILFTNKAATTDLYKALSNDFKGRLLFGEVRHTQKELVEKFQVTNFPTLVVVKPDGEKVVYSGKLSHEDLSAFLSTYAPAPKTGGAGAGAGAGEPKKQPTPEPDRPAQIHAVKTNEDFETHCLSKTGSCVIAFLDVEDEEGKRKDRDLAMLLEVAEKYKKSFHFLWVDAIKNLELAESLGTSILPSISVYNPSKKAYVPLVGAFEKKAISEFLDKVLNNRKPAVPQPYTRTLPKIVE